MLTRPAKLGCWPYTWNLIFFWRKPPSQNITSTRPVPLTPQVVLLAAYTLLSFSFLRGCVTPPLGPRRLLSRVEAGYLAGLVALEAAASWLLPAALGGRLPFLPLMATSLYCSAGMLYAWLWMAQEWVAIPGVPDLRTLHGAAGPARERTA